MTTTNNIVTCSFTMDRDTYNAFKSIVIRHRQNVKENLINYMQSVIDTEIPNADTINAMQEVEAMKDDSSRGKTYHNVDSMMQELLSA